MTSPVIPRDQAIAAARRALDLARARRDADRAAGQLPPEAELIMRRLEREQARRAAAGRPDRAAA
ncbi:hypothetical protein [Streptomyces sp. enrichment culture]|uniref:hypothetical protein n=1 Tax=Streptomyces sp. enrichment culture TaxID=1795815 RepID=UPI003F5672B0